MSAYGSRKFIVTLGAMLIALGMVLTDSLSAQEGVDAVLKAVAAYLLAEGGADIVGRLREPTTPPSTPTVTFTTGAGV